MTDIERTRVIERLKQSEGFRSRPYLCPAGRLTIGYGHSCDAKPLAKTILGVLREQADMMINGISPEEAASLLREDLTASEISLFAAWPWMRQLPDRVQGVLVDMAFNLGAGKLATFRRMLAALEARDYAKAADEMRNSAWAVQVKGRADELIRIMRQAGDEEVAA